MGPPAQDIDFPKKGRVEGINGIAFEVDRILQDRVQKKNPHILKRAWLLHITL